MPRLTRRKLTKQAGNGRGSLQSLSQGDVVHGSRLTLVHAKQDGIDGTHLTQPTQERPNGRLVLWIGQQLDAIMPLGNLHRIQEWLEHHLARSLASQLGLATIQ